MNARFLTFVFAAALPFGSAGAQDSVNFTSLDGAEIVDQSGASIGTLRDVIVSADGRVKQILIGSGGVLGMGETLRVIDTEALPALADGKIHMDNLSADNIAALPEYAEAEPVEQADSSPPPISGANQQAPQSASTDIPVTPAAAEPPPPAAAPTPVELPSAVPSAESSQSDVLPQPKIDPAKEEESAAGSGSSGMAPQQGTGTGATQASPSANEGGGRDEGVAGAGGQENPTYARDRAPENQPMPDSGAERATKDARAAEASADPEEIKAAPPSEVAEESTAQWRVGKIVGATVHGDRDGYSLKDVRFSANTATTAIIARADRTDAEVPFDALNLGGTRDAPTVALQPLPPAATP